MSLAILFLFLCAQHVSDINISIIRSLRLFLLNYHIGRIDLCSMCVGVSMWLGWSGVRIAGFSLLHGSGFSSEWWWPMLAEICSFCHFLIKHQLGINCSRIKDQLDVTCTTCASACNTDTTPTQPHRISNTHRTKNNTANVVIQQNSRKFLMMDILTSETCWAHKKWNKIASDIKLVFYSSTITMMHGPINIDIYTAVLLT